MENILLLTDFSANANSVAEYTYDFAKKIHADITLCNAMTIPSDMPNAGLVVWPMESHEVIKDRSASKLNKLRTHLQHRDQSHSKKPVLTLLNQAGSLQDVVTEIASERTIHFLAMGAHDESMDSFLKQDQTRGMIDSSPVPALLIPLKLKFEPIRNIYFASDLKDLPSDRIFLTRLTALARMFMSEIFIIHISSSKSAATVKEKIYDMLNDLRDGLGYPGIHFREIIADNDTSSLEKIMLEKRVDMIAVVHREHSFFSRLFKGSVAKKLAGQLTMPMLIYQESNK